jgi:RNA polymerase sigma-70 factor, ECF subfamily
MQLACICYKRDVSFVGVLRWGEMRRQIERAVTLLGRKDPASLEEALALLQDTVFSFSMKVCGQREDAEDTMQEVLVKSIPYLPRFDSPRALLVWLYRVAKNRCLMSRRRSKFAPTRDLSLDQLMPDKLELELLLKEGPVTPESQAIRNQQASRLREAVQKLPPPYRIILVLRDMEGLRDDEVAEITGLTRVNVRVRLHRARLFVRKELAKIGPARQASAKQIIQARSDTTEHPQPQRSRSCKAMFAELSDYLDDQLDDSLCNDLEKHFQGCTPCQSFLASLESTIEQLRALPKERLDRASAAKIRNQLLARYPFRRFGET